VPEAVQLNNPAICLAAAQQDGWALQYVPEALRDEKMCLAAVQQTWRALRYVPEAVQLNNPAICLAAAQQDGWALQYVPEAVQLTHPHICVTAVQQDGEALEFVPEAVQLAHPHICVAAVQQDGLALRYVPESLKTNVEALAKLYRTSEEELRSDLRLLQINDDVINQVICYLRSQIATSSSMIVELLRPSNDSKQNDSKQPAENTVNSINVIADDLLPIIQGYVYTPDIPGNDEKEIKDFSLS
jgi:hypothetical protein